MNQSIRFCTTPDGVQLAYAVSGEGPPLVMAATWLTRARTDASFKQNRTRALGVSEIMEENMRASMSRSIPAALIGASLAVAIPASAGANVITDWDEKAVAVVTPMSSLGGTSPYMAVRMMGMVHAAMFDAVNSIEQRYRPYLAQLPADPTTSKEATAAAAAAAVLATIDEKTAGDMKAILATYLAPLPEGVAKSDGVKLGLAVRQKCWRRGRTTAAMRLMPTCRGPHLASMCRPRSRCLQCGRT